MAFTRVNLELAKCLYEKAKTLIVAVLDTKKLQDANRGLAWIREAREAYDRAMRTGYIPEDDIIPDEEENQEDEKENQEDELLKLKQDLEKLELIFRVE